MKLHQALVGILVIAALGVGGWWYNGYSDTHPSTNDAYIGRHVVRIAAQVSGPIQEVRVSTNQSVKTGDLLLTIDPKPFDLAVQQAEAGLAQAQQALAGAIARVDAAAAQLALAEANAAEAARHAQRIAALVAKGSASKDEGGSAEQARQDATDALTAARAGLAAAKAARGALGDRNAAIEEARAVLDRARLNLAYTRLSAPADGVVGAFDLRPGSYIAAGNPLFALVESHDAWVDANFKETALPHIRAGQPATVTVDLLPGKTFRGEVEGLSPASGAAFSLLPPENATGNWVKVTQRFAVRVRILDPEPELGVGASAEVSIDTTAP
jgi:membrane fusion protein (multidrug efflux system)